MNSTRIYQAIMFIIIDAGGEEKEAQLLIRLGRNNPYIGSLEARVRHPTRNECMNWFAQIPLTLISTNPSFIVFNITYHVMGFILSNTNGQQDRLVV